MLLLLAATTFVEQTYSTDFVEKQSRRMNREDFVKRIEIAAQGDHFDHIRELYTQMLRKQLERGNNGLIKTCLLYTSLPNAVQIAVKDNGCGIHPEDLHHIFKRFYRSRFSQDKQGIGLGLPLAKTIVEAHSGTIRCV